MLNCSLCLSGVLHRCSNSTVRVGGKRSPKKSWVLGVLILLAITSGLLPALGKISFWISQWSLLKLYVCDPFHDPLCASVKILYWTISSGLRRLLMLATSSMCVGVVNKAHSQQKKPLKLSSEIWRRNSNLWTITVMQCAIIFITFWAYWATTHLFISWEFKKVKNKYELFLFCHLCFCKYTKRLPWTGKGRRKWPKAIFRLLDMIQQKSAPNIGFF